MSLQDRFDELRRRNKAAELAGGGNASLASTGGQEYRL
jgi:hypothetical protein